MPLTSSLALNNTRVDHRTQWDLSLGVISGDDRNTLPSLRGTFRLDGDVSERLEGRLFRREQEGWYAQAATFNRIRDVTITRVEAVDLVGMHLQLSITGTCALPGTPHDAYCTYTPGMSVDPDSLDPDVLVPRRFITDAPFGAVVSPEAMAAIRQPGWQRGVPGGQAIGLDLDFPNSGYLADEARRGESRVMREEEVALGQVLAFSRVQQDLLSNHQGAALGRTIRGVVLPELHDWSRRAIGWQLLALLLPSLEPGLKAGPAPPHLRLNNNLFLAANNARLPRDSFTLYHSGIARVPHVLGQVKGLEEVPAAHFLGIWLGLSPLIERRQTRMLRVEPTSPRQITSSSYSESEGASAAADVDGLILIDGLDTGISSVDISLLQDVQVQFGLELSKQSANLISSSRLVETTRYVPNLSLTGTATGGEHVLRYYAGALEGAGEDPWRLNAYLGLDWNYSSARGWRAHLGGIGYSEPSYDYFSEASGGLSKTFRWRKDWRLTLAGAATYAFDRTGDFEDFVLDYDGSRVDLSTQVERGPLSLTLTQGVDDILPDARPANRVLGLQYRLSPRIALSGRYTIDSEETSYVQGQAGLSWRLSDHKASPTLSLQWSRIRYDYGENSFGDALGATENLLLLSIQAGRSKG